MNSDFQILSYVINKNILAYKKYNPTFVAINFN